MNQTPVSVKITDKPIRRRTPNSLHIFLPSAPHAHHVDHVATCLRLLVVQKSARQLPEEWHLKPVQHVRIAIRSHGQEDDQAEVAEEEEPTEEGRPREDEVYYKDGREDQR